MELAKTIEDVRRLVKSAKNTAKQVGFVPTMGALHKGHLSLVAAAKKQTDFVVVSIFVNPTQFAPSEDLEKYPRPIENDLILCEKAGVDVVFNPNTSEMYPSEQLTYINVEGVTETLCGAKRQGHFQAVATVCAKLFNVVGADVAFFGQKDAQQVVVIKNMVNDLNLPIEIEVCPIVRETDGLAMSSRNGYLSQAERKKAARLYQSLLKAKEMIGEGQKNIKQIVGEMKDILLAKNDGAGNVKLEIDYVEMVDSEKLGPKAIAAGEMLVAVAIKIGQTRLIDNIIVNC